MNNLEKKLDALMRYATAKDEQDRISAVQELKIILELGKEPLYGEMLEREIQKVMFELNAPDNFLGHQYTVKAIQMVINKPEYIGSITYGIYPRVALEYYTTPSRVEKRIRDTIEFVFNHAPYEALEKYFGGIVNSENGKVTNGQFIARLANVVKYRLAEKETNS